MQTNIAILTAGSCALLLAACTVAPDAPTTRGKFIYAQECSQCHGLNGEGAGPASLGLGVAAPDLIGLAARNGGAFPLSYVRRYVTGRLGNDDPTAPMPNFATDGLQHVYPNGGADGEVLEADFDDLMAYLAAIQI